MEVGNVAINNQDNFITKMNLLMMVTLTVEYLVSNMPYHGLVVQERSMVMKAHSQVCLAFGYITIVAVFAQYKNVT